MSIDLGTDIACQEDLDATFGLVSGLDALVQAIVRRLNTAPGELVYDPLYGYDLRSVLNDTVTPSRVRAAVVAQCVAEERVRRARAAVTLQPDDTVRVDVDLETDFGPFSLVLHVSKVSVAVLRGQA